MLCSRSTIISLATISLATLAVCPTTCHAGYQDEVLADNPVAYWRLSDSSGSDAINSGSLGTSADGTYIGTTTWDVTSLLTSDSDSAHYFGGGRVNVPSVSGINTGSPAATKTIELWFKADTVSGRQMLYKQGNQNRGLNIYLDGNTLYVNGYNRIGNPSTRWGTPTPLFVSSPTAIQPDTVFYVALVMDGNSLNSGTITGYLDGVAFGSASGVGILYNHSQAMIGEVANQTRYHDNQTKSSGDGFYGVIDEVAHYSSALSAGRIMDHYNSGTASSSASGVRIIRWVEVP